MRRKIPNTAMLICFESAARHLSFTRAADELALTESAVSRKIALLEDTLSVQLFSRAKRRLQLTDAGAAYARAVRHSLERLEQDTAQAMAHEAGRSALELAVLPTFALKWLAPRLHEFAARHPEVTVNVSAREEPFLFSEHPFDAAIHFDHPVWANATGAYLFTEELIPVCRPALIGGARCDAPADLARYTLIHKSGRTEAWPRWFERAGAETVKALHGPRYSMYALAIEAALGGVGIALVPRSYVSEDLASGRLTMPWELATPGSKDYYFVVPEHKQASPAVQVFRDWLLAASASYRAAPEPSGP